ncbi:MAG: hypothetical protein IPJ84_14160 [Bdellovibrionales bacterium]|nr:hypothetical protein [Bdellovibrionales bacterium]
MTRTTLKQLAQWSLSILLTTAYSTTALPNRCYDLFSANSDQWKSLKLTPPHLFRMDNNYALLVHAITSSTELLEHPDLATKSAMLSFSLISNDKPFTFGNSGIVIGGDNIDVVVAAPSDMFVSKDLASISAARARFKMKGAPDLRRNPGAAME